MFRRLEYSWKRNSGYYRCFVNDPVKTKNKLRKLRYEQHDAKNSGAREKLYKRCGILRYKAQTASYMLLDFIYNIDKSFEHDDDVVNSDDIDRSYRDMLIDACDMLSRSYSFLNWGYILNYDQLTKLTEEIEKKEAKKKKHKKKRGDSTYNSVASEVFQMKLRLMEKSVSTIWKMVEPLHRIYASSVYKMDNNHHYMSSMTNRNGKKMHSFASISASGKNNKNPTTKSLSSSTSPPPRKQSSHKKQLRTLSPPPPEDLILKRMLNIQNEIYMCYDHLSSCRQFATIWQRTDEENDEIMKKQQEDIYITTADDNNNKSGTKSISTPTAATTTTTTATTDEKAGDEEKVEDKIETELRRLVNDSHVDDIFYKSLLHPKQYSNGHNTTINKNIGSKWSCLLCSKLNGTYDKFCQTCLSKHEHALLELEVIMFKLKHNKKKNDNGNAGKNTSGEDNNNKKLTSVGSRWRQFQQAEFHSRSRRSLTRRVGFNPDFDNN